MKPRTGSLLLLCCVLLIPVTYAFTASANQPGDDKKAVTRWEHLALPHDRADLGGGLGKQINRLGNEGWELICVTPVAKEGTTEKSIYYFKRRK